MWVIIYSYNVLINYCCCSVTQLYLALWDPMDCSQASLSLTISQNLPKFISIASVMSSSHLILCRPLLLLPSVFPSIRVFSNELAIHIRWPKYWSFSISHSSEYSGLISSKIGSISFLSKKLSRVFSSTTVWRLWFFGCLPSLWSSSHNPMWPLWLWKDHSLDYMDLCPQSNVFDF